MILCLTHKALSSILNTNKDISRSIHMSSARIFSSEEKAKLTQLVNEGLTVMQEVDDLNEGLNDTVKAIAEEMQIKPAVLKKAVRTAYKADFDKASEDHETLETILATVGKI
jgi:transposase-like protein